MVDLNATILILHTREAYHAAVHRVSDMHVIATILIFILHINGLNISIKRQKSSDGIKRSNIQLYVA